MENPTRMPACRMRWQVSWSWIFLLASMWTVTELAPALAKSSIHYHDNYFEWKHRTWSGLETIIWQSRKDFTMGDQGWNWAQNVYTLYSAMGWSDHTHPSHLCEANLPRMIAFCQLSKVSRSKPEELVKWSQTDWWTFWSEAEPSWYNIQSMEFDFGSQILLLKRKSGNY